MQNKSLLQRLTQTLVYPIILIAKKSNLITHIYTFFYNLGFFHQKSKKAKKIKNIKKIPAMQLMQQSSDLIQRIYGRLGNNYSKKMYTNRLLYNITKDKQYLYNMIEMKEEGAFILKQLNDAQSTGKKIFIFADKWYYWVDIILDTFDNINFCGCVDNEPKEKKYKNLPVLSFEEYLQQKDNSVIIIIDQNENVYKKQYIQLIENNVKVENIIKLGEASDIMYKQQYFDLPELRNAEKEHEIFVDCGCYDGATSKIFAEWHGNKKGTVYAFEADPQNKVVCEKKIAEINTLYTGGGIILPCFL